MAAHIIIPAFIALCGVIFLVLVGTNFLLINLQDIPHWWRLMLNCKNTEKSEYFFGQMGEEKVPVLSKAIIQVGNTRYIVDKMLTHKRMEIVARTEDQEQCWDHNGNMVSFGHDSVRQIERGELITIFLEKRLIKNLKKVSEPIAKMKAL